MRSTFKVRYLLHLYSVRFRGRVSLLGVLCVMLYYTILLSSWCSLKRNLSLVVGEISRYIRTSSPFTLITLLRSHTKYHADLCGTRGGATAHAPGFGVSRTKHGSMKAGGSRYSSVGGANESKSQVSNRSTASALQPCRAMIHTINVVEPKCTSSPTVSSPPIPRE